MRSIRGFLASAGRGGISENGPGLGAPGRAVWLSLDPRTSQVIEYPEAVSQRLEAAAVGAAGKRSEVRLAGLGGMYESLIVYVDVPPGGGCAATPIRGVQENAMTGGKRDVRRMCVPEDATEVRLHVQRVKGWRFADAPAFGVTEERRVPLLSGGGPPSGGGAPAGTSGGASGSGALPSGSAEEEARRQALADNRRNGLVGLWEWSKLLHTARGSSDRQDAWGVYSAEQNEDIEAAWCDGRFGVCVAVGIRNYELEFRGVDGGRQVDRALRKSRQVRRRAVTPEERDAALSCPASQNDLVADCNADGECAICYTAFAESPSVPVVVLPGCGHAFHCACVQHIADKRGTCPFCRGDVDWAAALAPPCAAAAAGTSQRVPL